MANAMVLESAKEAVDHYFSYVNRRIQARDIAYNTLLDWPFRIMIEDVAAFSEHVVNAWKKMCTELGCLDDAPFIDRKAPKEEHGGNVITCVVTVLYARPRSVENQNLHIAQLMKDLAAVEVD
jgi:hypothetical protein